MNPLQNKISRKRLINKAISLGISNATILSNKSLLKTVNRHNINKKLRRIFSNERSDFTKSDLDQAIELNELSLDDVKKLSKFRKIPHYCELTYFKNDLFYALLRSEKEPQENSYLKYSNYTTRSDLKERINHVRLMTAKLGNKITNERRTKIRNEMNDVLKTKHTSTIRKRAINRIVELTNELYMIQKQHTSKHKDQTYYGIKDIEHLYNGNIYDYYEPMSGRWSFNNNFEEYEIRGDKYKSLSVKEHLNIIYPQLEKLIDEKKKALIKSKRYN